MKIKNFIAILLVVAIIFPQLSVFAGDMDTISELPNYSALLYDSIDDSGNGSSAIGDGATISLKNQIYYVVDKSLYTGEGENKVQDVEENIEYTIILPEPLRIYETKKNEKIMFEGDVEGQHISCAIGSYNMIAGDNKVSIIFNMENDDSSSIDFSWVTNFHLAIECYFDEQKANDMANDNGKIEITLPKDNINLIVEELKPEEPIEPTLTKTVTKAMDNTGLASWKIVYTAPNNAYIDNPDNKIPIKLVDELPTGLKFSGDINISLNKKGQTINSVYKNTDDVFVYSIDSDVEKITITYNTKLTDEEFAKALAGNTQTYKNTVNALDKNEYKVLTSSATINTSSIKILISKKAYDVTYHAAEGENKAYYTLDWEIVVDAQGKQLDYLNLSDTLIGKAIIISPKIMDSDENFEKLDMEINYVDVENTNAAPFLKIKKEDLTLSYNSDKSRVTGFNLDLTNYLGTDKGEIDTTKKFKITYRTQVDETYLTSLDPNQIDKNDFKNTVFAEFKFGEMKSNSVSKTVEALPDDTIDPLITITPAGVEKNNLALKWNVTINPPRNITGAQFDMTEILFEDIFVKNIAWPNGSTKNDYQSFGWTEEKRQAQIDSIKQQILDEGVKSEDINITLTEAENNYILNVSLKNTGTKPISFSYYTYGTNPFIWASNRGVDFSYTSDVKLLAQGTAIDGQKINTDITAMASQKAGNGKVLLTWPLDKYYVSEKKIDWEIWLNDKGSLLGDIKLNDILPYGVSYIEGSARISAKGGNSYTEADFKTLSEQESETEDYVIYNAEAGELEFYIDNVSSKRAIRFSTTIDYEKLGSKYDKTINLINKADLYIKPYEGLYPSMSETEWVKTQSISETAKIKNNILQKTSTTDSTKVNYKVIINPLGLEILSTDNIHLYIEDKLDDGLVFDEESVKLYKANIADQSKNAPSDHTYNPTNITKGEEITGKNIVFDSASNKMTLELPETNIAYIVEYTAYITRKNVELNNNIRLIGSSVPEASSQYQANNSVKLGSYSGATLRPPANLFYSVVVKKTDEKNNPLSGATIGLYTSKSESGRVGVGVSSADGSCIISVKNKLVKDFDTLYVKEITAPNGYVIDETWHEFKKEEGGNSTESNPILTIKNVAVTPETSGVLRILRYDEDTYEPLAFACLSLYENSSDTQVFKEGQTDTEGILYFYGLDPSKQYYLVETKAPGGYPIDSDYENPVEVTPIEIQKDTKLEEIEPVEVKSGLEPVTLTVVKQDGEDKTPLVGAEFALYKKSDLSDTPIIKTTDENGKAEFTELDATKAYWLQETKAPEGYLLDDEIIVIDFSENKKDMIINVDNNKDPDYDDNQSGGGDDNNPPGGGDDNNPPGGGDDNNPPGGGDDNNPPGGGDDNNPPGGGDDNNPPEGGSSGGSSSGGGSSEKPNPPEEEFVLEYECNGGTFYEDENYSTDELVKLGKVPYRAGYIFTGWYADEELTQLITDVTMTEDKIIYAGWKKYVPSDMLNTDDHFAYIIGYPDGNVKPTGDITRAEVATIFFRLLEPSIREENLTNKGSFNDVISGMWHNIAISTVQDLGIVTGYQDGSFRPDKSITRAELATIATRFDKTDITLYDSFSDIDGHWAEDSIKKAVALGWVTGYPDGTFKPDEPITRAEAMTLINNVLLRLPEYETDLLDSMIVWPDNLPDAWYYLAVQEATNSHDYRIKDDGIFEIWTKINPVEEWVKYQEKPIQENQQDNQTEQNNQNQQDSNKYEQSDHLYGRFYFFKMHSLRHQIFF